MPNYFLINNSVCLAGSENYTIPVHHQSPRVPQKDSGVSFLLCKPTEKPASSFFKEKSCHTSYILSEPNRPAKAFLKRVFYRKISSATIVEGTQTLYYFL